MSVVDDQQRTNGRQAEQMVSTAPGTPAEADARPGDPGSVSRGPVTAGPGLPLGGPGAPPADARPPVVVSRDPDAHPVPTGREEAWRFTPLDRLGDLFAAPAADGQVDDAISGADGVEVAVAAADDPRLGAGLELNDRLRALALARAPQVQVLRVPPGRVVDQPVRIDVRTPKGTAYDHRVVDVGAGAELTLVVTHTGTGTLNANWEFLVGADAGLTVVFVQDADRDAVHVGGLGARVGAGARFRSVIVTLGGDLVRLCPTVAFDGPGGDAELSGVLLTQAGQHHEHRLFLDHQPPHCRSRVVYKGALSGEGAHSVWIGDVLLGPDAVGSDTYEINRNLVLSDGARADSVPNLEIETGEVIGAGHASATGRFDDEALFYLMSRGIPAEEARRLVVRGFFAEVLATIPVPDLVDRLTARVDAELGMTGTEAGA